jgi:hypothetical protein
MWKKFHSLNYTQSPRQQKKILLTTPVCIYRESPRRDEFLYFIFLNYSILCNFSNLFFFTYINVHVHRRRRRYNKNTFCAIFSIHAWLIMWKKETQISYSPHIDKKILPFRLTYMYTGLCNATLKLLDLSNRQIPMNHKVLGNANDSILKDFLTDLFNF